MYIEKVPQNFSGSADSAVYVVSGADPTRVTEIDIYSPDDRLLGVKRFKGENQYNIELTPYLRREFEVAPYNEESIGFFNPDGRVAGAKIVAITQGDDPSGGMVSQVTYFTAGLSRQDHMHSLTNLDHLSTICMGEFDEISFIAPAGPILAVLTLDGEAEEVSISYNDIFTEEQLCSFFLRTDQLASDLGKQNLDPFSTMRIDIYSGTGKDSTLIAQRKYSIVSQASTSVRLCWVNTLGGVDYRTFLPASQRDISIEKRFCHTTGGAVSLGATAAGSIKLTVECEPQQVMHWTREMICSSKVWRVENGDFIPVVVEATDIPALNSSAAPFQLIVRDAEPERFPSI